MHQTRKGKHSHFMMEEHIGVDAYTGIGHSMSATAANADDVTQANDLMHRGETEVWSDAGYQEVHKRRENLRLLVEWRVAMRPGNRRKLDPESGETLAEKVKASVRAKSLPPSPMGGGAPLPEAEASVRVHQGTLPGASEEHGTAGTAVRAGQLANGGG